MKRNTSSHDEINPIPGTSRSSVSPPSKKTRKGGVFQNGSDTFMAWDSNQNKWYEMKINTIDVKKKEGEKTCKNVIHEQFDMKETKNQDVLMNDQSQLAINDGDAVDMNYQEKNKNDEKQQEIYRDFGGNFNNINDDYEVLDEKHGDYEDYDEYEEEEEYDDDDDDQLSYGAIQALPVMKESDVKNKDVKTWNSLPETPEEYLYRVRYITRNVCPRVKVASNIDIKKYEQIAELNLHDTYEKYRNGKKSLTLQLGVPLSPSITSDGNDELYNQDVVRHESMKQECLKQFEKLRDSVKKQRIKYESKGILPTELDEELLLKIPKGKDWVKWRDFCFGFCKDGDKASEQSLISEERNHSVIGHEPSLQILFQLDYVITHGLFHQMSQWIVKDNIIDRHRFCWVHALLLVLDCPPISGTAADLNELFLWALEARDRFINGCTAENQYVQEIAPLNMLLAIISMYFKQGDPSLA